MSSHLWLAGTPGEGPRRHPFLRLVSATVSTQSPRFYSDDPIAKEPDSRDASGVQPWDIGLMYELSYNLFVTSGYKPTNTRARNINTIDEVPDSSWFTNRIGSTDISAAQITRGPEIGTPPSPERWVILREKTAGANPGFTARDANGETWFLGFDPPSRPEGATAAVVIATKLFWALGYNQVEMFLTTFDPAPCGDRSGRDRAATVRQADAVHPRRHERGARQRGAQRRRHLPRGRRPSAAGKGARRLPVRRHAA